jgi:hypothetical protein
MAVTALKWWWKPETQSPCDAVAVAAEERDLAEPAALLPL